MPRNAPAQAALHVLTFLGWNLLMGVALLALPPLAGLLVFFVPYPLTSIGARLATREHDVIATAQVIAGGILYGAWVALLAALVWQTAGRSMGIATLIGLPILAVASGWPVMIGSIPWTKPQLATATSGKVRKPALRSSRSRFQPIGKVRM